MEFSLNCPECTGKLIPNFAFYDPKLKYQLVKCWKCDWTGSAQVVSNLEEDDGHID